MVYSWVFSISVCFYVVTKVGLHDGNPFKANSSEIFSPESAKENVVEVVLSSETIGKLHMTSDFWGKKC